MDDEDRAMSWVLLVVGALTAARLSCARWEAGMTLALVAVATGLHGLWSARRRGTLGG